MQSVGSVRPAPAPSSKVAGEMLNVLSAFGGGDKKLRALLEKIEETQKYNEGVIEQAQAARSEAIQQQRTARVLVDEAKQIKDEADAAKSAFERLSEQTTLDLDAQRQEITVRGTTLDRELAAFEAKVNRENGEAVLRRVDLDKRQSYVEGRESRMASAIETFRGHVDDIKNAYSRMSELNTAVSRLNDWITHKEGRV